MVLEKWFFKLGFFFPVNHFSRTRKKIWVSTTTSLQPEKIWIYSINPPFFWSTTFLDPDFLKQISRITFLKPLFYNFLEKWLQNKWSTVHQGSIGGPLGVCRGSVRDPLEFIKRFVMISWEFIRGSVQGPSGPLGPMQWWFVVWELIGDSSPYWDIKTIFLESVRSLSEVCQKSVRFFGVELIRDSSQNWDLKINFLESVRSQSEVGQVS